VDKLDERNQRARGFFRELLHRCQSWVEYVRPEGIVASRKSVEKGRTTADEADWTKVEHDSMLSAEVSDENLKTFETLSSQLFCGDCCRGLSTLDMRWEFCRGCVLDTT
jgi:hypothetical protein